MFFVNIAVFFTEDSWMPLYTGTYVSECGSLMNVDSIFLTWHQMIGLVN